MNSLHRRFARHSLAAVAAAVGFSTVTAFTQPSLARNPDFEGMVDLANGQKIFAIEYKAQASAPTVVLVHGLTYTTAPWQPLVKQLADAGYGVLTYDARGMGKTLEATGPAKASISLEQQADDLDQLLSARSIPRATFAGLSYGGAVAMVFGAKYPERIESLVLMAPYVKALKAQDDHVRNQIRIHRLTRPTDKRTDDELYDVYLKDLIFKTYPMAEPVVRDHPWRLEAIFQMVREARHFKASELVARLPKNSVHLVVAGRDQYVPAADLNEFWSQLPKETRLSRIDVQGSEHKLPEAVPLYLAGWLKLASDKDARLTGGAEFRGTPAQGTAVSRSAQITDLPKDFPFFRF